MKAPVPGDRRFARDELLGPTTGGGGGRTGVAEGFYSDVLSQDLTDRGDAQTLRRLQS